MGKPSKLAAGTSVVVAAQFLTVAVLTPEQAEEFPAPTPASLVAFTSVAGDTGPIYVRHNTVTDDEIAIVDDFYSYYSIRRDT